MPDTAPSAWSLPTWLDYIERQHPVAWDLGLARVGAVGARLSLLQPAPQVLTIAGTNGKGSTTTAIEQLLIALGLKVGATLSPHMFKFNERIRIAGTDVDDAAICTAFTAIESARGAITLTYFEYAMLAALYCFKRAAVDVAVIEVGLGGRLDASNIVDADVAVVTSVGIDHVDYLGADRETIGTEKIAIARVNRPVVLGEVDPPQSVLNGANTIGARVLRRDHDFTIEPTRSGFRFALGSYAVDCQVAPRLALYNVASALAAVVALGQAPTSQQVDAAMTQARVRGRAQEIKRHVPVIVDVAHNPHGAAFLAQQLAERFACPSNGTRHCVLGTLADKDALGIISALADGVDRWYCAGTSGPRGFPGDRLQALIAKSIPSQFASSYVDVPTALEAALATAVVPDRVVVCGCFQAAGQALQWLGSET